MANLIFSHLNKNKPRSILLYINFFFFFFLLQFNPNNVMMHVVPTHVSSNHNVSQTRWPGSSRQLERSWFPFSYPSLETAVFFARPLVPRAKTRATRAALRSRWPLTTDSSWLSFSEFLPSPDWSGRFIRGGCLSQAPRLRLDL